MPINSLVEFRAAVRSSENSGILLGGWSSRDGVALKEVAPFLQEMADDIQRWFKPEQRWTLAGMRWGMISLPRITASSDQALVAKKPEVDKFTPVFHFDSEKAPLTGTRFSSGYRRVHVFNTFQTDFRNDHVADETDTMCMVYPEKVGQIKPLDEALKDLAVPYYLLGVQVSANHRHDPLTEKARSISVMVHARDLGDYIKQEALNLRRLRSQFDKKFALSQPEQAQAAS